MKLSLRKAHRLVKDLQSKLAVRNTAQIVHHSADFDEVKEAITTVEAQNRANVEQALLVVDAISDIRAAVQVLNARDVDGNSIDALLNAKAKVESKMKVLTAFSNPNANTQAKREVAIQRQVNDAATNAGTGYHSSEVTVMGHNVDTHNEFNEQYVALKQEQEQISDKLAYINNLLQVEVDDKYTELFKALQVL